MQLEAGDLRPGAVAWLWLFTACPYSRREQLLASDGGGKLATGLSCLAMAVYRMSLFSFESSYWHQMEAGNLRPGSDEAEALLTSS